MRHFLSRLAPKRRLGAVALAAVLAAGTVADARADTYTQTRYPIVMVPGLFGFDSIGPVRYFFGVPLALRSGGATVFTPTISSANNTEVRGEQLLRSLRALKAAYGYEKFNLIGHSHGGPNARYVAGVAPELVASITTVSSPHAGSAFSDGLLAISGLTLTTPVVQLFGSALSAAVQVISGNYVQPVDFVGALTAMSSPGAAAFTQRFPAGAPTSPCGQGPELASNGVRYYSVGGTSVLTNVLDVSDALWAISSVFFLGTPNDGFTGKCSSHWGTVLKDDYRWNHFDDNNQALGLRGLFSEDPLAFYRSQANRLKAVGL